MSNYATIIFAFVFITAMPFAGRKDASLTKNYQQKKQAVAWTASWSYDDRFVAVGSDNGELSIYETRQWQKVKTWKFHSTTITRVEWP